MAESAVGFSCAESTISALKLLSLCAQILYIQTLVDIFNLIF